MSFGRGRPSLRVELMLAGELELEVAGAWEECFLRMLGGWRDMTCVGDEKEYDVRRC